MTRREEPPFEGVPITWSVTGGGGTLSSTATTTDINGRSSVMLTLGSSPGANTVTASQTHDGLTNMLVFTATGTPLVQQQQAEGEEGGDGGGNKPPKENPVSVARDVYLDWESIARDARQDVFHYRLLKGIYDDKIDGFTGTLSARVLSLAGAVAGKSYSSSITGLLNVLKVGNADAIISGYNEALDELDRAHQFYKEAIDAADKAYDKYSGLTGGEPMMEKRPRKPYLDVAYTCGNRNCPVTFDTNDIGYPGAKNGLERWSARVAAKNAHLDTCRVKSSSPGCDRAKEYYGKCPGGSAQECDTSYLHFLPCTNFDVCKTEFPQSTQGLVLDAPHHCTERVKDVLGGSLGLTAQCGQYSNDYRFCTYRGVTNEVHCKNRQNHLVNPDCGHKNVPRKELPAHNLITGSQCPYHESGLGGRRCQRMEYYVCGYYHGKNRDHDHEFATASPSQQPSEPATLPSTPEPVTQNDPAPAPVIQPDPVPEEETTVPEEPEEETTVPEEPEEDDDDETSGTTTPTSSPTDDSGNDDDDDSEDSEDSDDDDDDDDDEPAPAPPAPPPPPPPTVLCGNSWRGGSACTSGRVASTRTAHRITCRAGHNYWGCNPNAENWHGDRTCVRSGCGVTFTKCTNAHRGSNPCRFNPGGWHTD